MKKVKELQEIAKNTYWMSDVKDCLKEDLDDVELTGNIQEDVQELVNMFEDRWQETDYFKIKVLSKATNIASKKIRKEKEDLPIEEEVVKVYEYAFDLINENFWEVYHNKHNTYKVAEEMIKDKLKGEEYAKRN